MFRFKLIKLSRNKLSHKKNGQIFIPSRVKGIDEINNLTITKKQERIYYNLGHTAILRLTAKSGSKNFDKQNSNKCNPGGLC
jgi:hypothetical protein